MVEDAWYAGPAGGRDEWMLEVDCGTQVFEAMSVMDAVAAADATAWCAGSADGTDDETAAMVDWAGGADFGRGLPEPGQVARDFQGSGYVERWPSELAARRFFNRALARIQLIVACPVLAVVRSIIICVFASFFFSCIWERSSLALLVLLPGGVAA